MTGLSGSIQCLADDREALEVMTRDGLSVSEEFYDEDGKKRRTPQIETVKLNAPIASSVFTQANMQRSGQ